MTDTNQDLQTKTYITQVIGDSRGGELLVSGGRGLSGRQKSLFLVLYLFLPFTEHLTFCKVTHRKGACKVIL